MSDDAVPYDESAGEENETETIDPRTDSSMEQLADVSRPEEIKESTRMDVSEGVSMNLFPRQSYRESIMTSSDKASASARTASSSDVTTMKDPSVKSETSSMEQAE